MSGGLRVVSKRQLRPFVVKFRLSGGPAHSLLTWAYSAPAARRELEETLRREFADGEFAILGVRRAKGGAA
jgi:hypothetical protein